MKKNKTEKQEKKRYEQDTGLNGKKQKKTGKEIKEKGESWTKKKSVESEQKKKRRCRNGKNSYTEKTIINKEIKRLIMRTWKLFY